MRTIGWTAVIMLAWAGMVRADTYASYHPDSPGQYPSTNWLERPYRIQYTSRFDGTSDWFAISFPDDFNHHGAQPRMELLRRE